MTSIPASQSRARPRPLTPGLGSAVATITRLIPEARIASTQGGVRFPGNATHGSRLR